MARPSAVCLFVLASACEGPTGLPRDVDAPFQTDSLEYMLQRESSGYVTVIGFVFTNLQTEPVHFANCGGLSDVRFERLSGESFRPTAVWGPDLPGCEDDPTIVEPFGQVRAHLGVLAGDASDTGDPRGTYRIIWNRGSTPFGTLLPLEQRVSNRFKLSFAREGT